MRAVMFVGLLLVACAAWAVSYVYDANGRLVGVTNASGQSARYSYDEMGNLTGIERFAVSDLAIHGFAPARGAAGTTVEIRGQGFSTTPGANTVRFNGTTATVSSAAPDKLSVLVPASATTGPITVAVASQTASSGADFVIDANAKAPVITSVSPTIVDVAALITITGWQLEPLGGQTAVRLADRPVNATSVDTVQIVFPAPARTGSGKIGVTTPYGSALSVEDVVVAPVGVPASSIEQSKRVAIDGVPLAFAISASDGRAAALIQATAGDYLSAQFTSISAQIEYALYDTANSVVVRGYASATSPTFHLPRAKRSGTYLLLMSAGPGGATWNLAVEKAKTLTADGSSQNVLTTVSGQEKRLTFQAGTVSNLGLGVVDPDTGTAQWANASLSVRNSDGNQIGYLHCQETGGGCGLNLSGVSAGSYDIVIAPALYGARTMQFGTVLSSDTASALLADMPYTAIVSRRGQNARLIFAGAAGTTVALQIAGQTTVPAGGDAYYRVIKPDGTTLASTATKTGGIVNLALPATGDYQVLVDPARGETLTAQMLLATGTDGETELDGDSGTYTTTQAGETVYFSFLAAAGQSLGFGISDLTLGSGTYGYVAAHAPDGSVVSSGFCYASDDGCDVNFTNTVAGRYAIAVTPADGSQTMAFETTLSSDLQTSLVKDVAATVDIARRGQNARFAFSGTANEVVALQVSGMTSTPAGSDAYVRLYKPDGTSLSSMRVSANGTLNAVLPVTGTYQVMVDPYAGAATAFDLTLSTGTTTGTVLDGETGSLETTAGQSAFFTFSATAGMNAGVGISDIVVNASTYIKVQIKYPNGTQHSLTNCYVADQGCGINLSNMTAGTWSVTVLPFNASQTMKFRATLSTDLGGTLPRNATWPLSLTRRGQNARLSFAGTVGESMSLQTGPATTVPGGRSVYYGIYRPNGTLWKSFTTAAPAILHLGNLPETGTYRLLVDPSLGSLASMTLALPGGIGGGLELDAGQGTYSASAGQAIVLRFDAQAAQNYGLGISDMVLGSGSSVGIEVFRPDGTQSVDSACAASTGCQVNFANTQAGRYSVYLIPSASQSMSFKATLTTDTVTPLARDLPANLEINRRGQNVRFTFGGTAGESLALLAYNQVTTPTGVDIVYTVYKPDGTSWKSMTANPGYALSLANLPATGQYTVLVDAAYGALASSQVVLSTGKTDMQPDGASAQYETVLPAQPIHLSFQATAGQNLGFALSDIATANSSYTYFYVYAYRPDGTEHASTTCYASTGICDLNFSATQAGRYSILVYPRDGAQAMRFNATLSSDKVVALVRDQFVDFIPDRPGQNGRLSFVATAGEILGLIVPYTGTDIAYRTYRLNGSLWSSTTTDRGIFFTYTPALGAGTYYVMVDPVNGAMSPTKLKLSTGTNASIDGASTSFSTDLSGDSAFITFDAVAGQRLGLAVSDLVAAGGVGVSFTDIHMFRPDGAHIDYMVPNDYCPPSTGCEYDFTAQTGRYSFFVTRPSGTVSGKFTITNELQDTLTSGVPKAMSLNRRGMGARYTFSGTAGHKFTLTVSDQASAPADRGVSFRILKPSDSAFYWRTHNFIDHVGAATTAVVTMPDTGTYTMIVDPEHGIETSATIQVDVVP